MGPESLGTLHPVGPGHVQVRELFERRIPRSRDRGTFIVLRKQLPPLRISACHLLSDVLLVTGS